MCPPQGAAELLAQPPAARASFLGSVQRLLAGSAHPHTKLALLCYLESLAQDSGMAHELTAANTELAVFMVRCVFCALCILCAALRSVAWQLILSMHLQPPPTHA